MAEADQRKRKQFGIDKELTAKINSKFDDESVEKVKIWIAALTGEEFSGEFGERLQSGVLLCQLINCIQPGSAMKFKETQQPFKRRENILKYCDACIAIGMKQTDIFQTNDLLEFANLSAVLTNLICLSLHSRTLDSFNGPFIERAKPTEREVKHWTDHDASAGATKPGAYVAGKVEETAVDHVRNPKEVLSDKKRATKSDPVVTVKVCYDSDVSPMTAFPLPKESWASDKEVKNCHSCNAKFTITKRKHHCRMCG